MSNRIYVSHSAERSTSDAWTSDFMEYLRITLEEVASFPVEISAGPAPEDDSSRQLREADLVILVFNGFISDGFAREMKLIESAEWEKKGKDIFVVVKSGKFRSIVPGYLRKYCHYNFFDINSRTNEIIDFSPSLKGESEQRFWPVITDLAFDCRLFLEKLNHQPASPETAVYLAEVSRDQSIHREILKREFLLSGFQVVPLKPLPGTYKEYHESVKELLGAARISVHILGETYGDSPAGSDYSYPEIQNKVVSEISMQAGRENFYRFVWMPPFLEPYDEKQVQYLKRLRKELNDHGKGEIIQCSIEEFKEIVFQKIRQLSSPVHGLKVSPQGKIVLITEDSGKAVSQKIESLIKIGGNEYELIDMSQARELFPSALFNHKLQASEKAIILNTSGNIRWLQAMLGLTIKQIHHGKDPEKSIAAVTSLHNRDAVDFQALNVGFFTMEDSRLTEHMENFLTQKISYG